MTVSALTSWPAMRNNDNYKKGVVRMRVNRNNLIVALAYKMFIFTSYWTPSRYVSIIARERRFNLQKAFDCYVLLWTIFIPLAFILISLFKLPPILEYMLLTFALLRIFDILHTAACILFFVEYRPGDRYVRYSFSRSLIMTSIGYIHMVALFGIVYFSLGEMYSPAIKTWLQALSFSILHSTSIGSVYFAPINLLSGSIGIGQILGTVFYIGFIVSHAVGPRR